MRSRVSLYALLLIAGSLALPLAAQAAIPFFGPIIPQEANQAVCPASWGLLVNVINNLISFLITLAIVFVAPLMIAYSGYLFVVNPVDPSGIAKAKGILTNTVVGIVVALAGWMIVDAIMAVLYNKDAPGLAGKTWSSLITSGGIPSCLPQRGALPGEGFNQATPGSGVTTGSVSGAGGSCTAPASGPCSSNQLQSSCFASNAGQAAQICSKESSGNANNLSRSDKTADGQSYSVGLFQINLTNSYAVQVDGQSCANAFTQPCQNSGGYHNVQPSGACSSSIKTGTCGSVSCSQLYANCVASAQNVTNNINQACRLSGNGSNWNPWRNTANACSLR